MPSEPAVTVPTYKGRPITDLSRDEAIAALDHCMSLLRAEREAHQTTIEMQNAFDAAREALMARRH